jgi:tRNA(Ile)-lysidine synthase
MSDGPITTAEFQSRLTAFGAPARFIVAVSGGPDSMALARLAAAYATTARAQVLAVTVDHGLRPEARGEAETAGRWCAEAGLAHRIVAWDGEKPATGVQAAARAARYKILASLAESEAYGAILVGHNADDQAETVFMRLARGAGPAGLSGMAAETLIAAGPGSPVRLLRPLLDVPRARILATVRAMEQPFIDDPSNEDPSFERVRTRALLGALEEQKLLTREALLRTAARMRAAATRIDAADAEAFAAAGGKFHRWAWAALDRWENAPPSLIARLIRAVSGQDYAPGEEEAAVALQTVKDGGAATLGGAMLKRHGRGLAIIREPAALLGRAGVTPMEPVTLTPGERILWDRRFIISSEACAPSMDANVEVAPLGGRAADYLELGAPGAPIEALQASPGFDSTPGSGGVLRLESLLEERFAGRVVRFS